MKSPLRFSVAVCVLLNASVLLAACSGGSNSEVPEAQNPSVVSESASTAKADADTTAPDPDAEPTFTPPPSVGPGSAVLPASTGGASPEPPNEGFSAEELILRGEEARDNIESGHAVVEVTVSGPGSQITTVVELEMAGDTTYTRIESFGVVTEALELPGQLCLRIAGGEWEAQDPAFAANSTGLGDILMEMNSYPFSGLERLPDSTLPDGRRVHVLRAQVAEGVLGGDRVGSDLFTDQTEASVKSASVEVMLDTETYFMLVMRMESIVTIQGSELTQTIVATTDRHNLPARFPPDLPVSCSTFTS